MGQGPLQACSACSCTTAIDELREENKALVTQVSRLEMARNQLKMLVESEMAKRKSHAKGHHLQLLETEDLRMLVDNGDKRIERLATELEEERRGHAKERRERKRLQEKADQMKSQGCNLMERHAGDMKAKENEVEDLRQRNKDLLLRVSELELEQQRSDGMSDDSPTAAALRRSINLSNSVMASIFPRSPAASSSHSRVTQ